MKKQKTSLSFIITTLVVGLVTLFLLWSTFYFFSLYVGSMKQAAHTSSEQAVTQASNAISNYIGDMQEIMSLIEKNLTKERRKIRPDPGDALQCTLGSRGCLYL